MAERIFILLTVSCCLNFNSWAQNIELTVQTGHSATINKLSFSPDGRLLASAGSDNNIVLWDVGAGRQLVTLSGHSRKVNGVSFHPDGRKLASGSDDGKVIFWDIETGNADNIVNYEYPVKGVSFSADGRILGVAGTSIVLYDCDTGSQRILPFRARTSFNTLAFSTDGKLVAFGGVKERRVRVVRIDDNSLISQYSLRSNELKFSPDNVFLSGAGANGRLKRWNISRGKAFSTVSITADRIWQSFNCVVIDEKYFVGGNRNNLIYVYSRVNGKKIKVLNGHRQDVNALAIGPDGRFLASAGEERKIVFWDLSTWDVVKTLEGTSNKINDLEFSADGKSMVIAYGDGSMRYWEMTPGGKMFTNQLKPGRVKQFLRWEYTVSDILGWNDNQVELLAYRIRSRKRDSDRFKAKGYRLEWNLESNSVKLSNARDIGRTSYEGLLNPENTTSRVGLTESEVEGDRLKVSFEDRQKSFSIAHDHSDRVTAVKVHTGNGVIATAGFDGLIKLRELKTGALMCNFLASEDQDYIYVTPENYYFSTKGALNHIGFRVNSNVFTFEQFDLKYNRPDIVLNALNHGDTTVVYAYEKAYEKRLQKSAVSLEDLTSFEDIPSVEIQGTEASLTSRNKQYSFRVKPGSAETPVDKLFVDVNGVPVYPSGTPVSDATDKEIMLDLSYGVNHIRYYVTNTKGISSLKHGFQVTYKSSRPDPVLYLVTIGASRYRQDRFNLKYAAKDASDIESLFQRAGRFGSVKRISLLNEDVTLANFHALADFLAQANVDDMVLITYAGHGVLDANLDYYLSTYEIDFQNPSSGGLPFSEVERLLENIRSRNKVLMIDACHSGEIDKEELQLASASVPVADGNISFRTVGSGVTKKDAIGLKTSFELSKTLFADMKTTHGAVIISSAGGGEYAIEGNEWNNGIFTYCFIDGLRSRKSDLNQDGKVSVLELQRYLATEVPRLTDGRQTPTSREENLSNNFIIW